jgi:hypothetical protein
VQRLRGGRESAADILSLQRALGNRAVGRMLQRQVSVVQRHPEQEASIAANAGKIAENREYSEFVAGAHDQWLRENTGRIDYVSGWAEDGIVNNQAQIEQNSGRIANLEQSQGQAGGGDNVVVPAVGGV